MIDTNQPHIFLCHSSVDKPVVREFYGRLVKDGIGAWLDEKELLPGQNWQDEIFQAIKNSHVIIVFLSSHSVENLGYVRKEIKLALDVAQEKPEEKISIIPVRIDECKVPEILSHYQWVDLFQDKGYERIKQAVLRNPYLEGSAVGESKMSSAKVEKPSVFGGLLTIIVGSVTVLSLVIGIAGGLNSVFKILMVVGAILIVAGIFLLTLANESIGEVPLAVDKNNVRMIPVLRRTGKKRNQLLIGWWVNIILGIVVLLLAFFIAPDSPVWVVRTQTPTLTYTATTTSTPTFTPTISIAIPSTKVASKTPTLKPTGTSINATATP